MYKPKERYNSKARGSVAGGKKKGKRHRSEITSNVAEPDANATILVTKTKTEKEAERVERMRNEVRIYYLRCTDAL